MQTLMQFMGSAAAAGSGAVQAGTVALAQRGVGGLLEAGGTALSALQMFGLARQQSRQLRMDARVEGAAARAEIGTYDQTAKAATDRYLDAVAATRAAAAASGVDVASGSVEAVNSRSRDELGSFLAVARENAVAGAVARRARAEAMIAEARNRNRAGWLSLIGAGAQLGASRARRGTAPGPAPTPAPAPAPYPPTVIRGPM